MKLLATLLLTLNAFAAFNPINSTVLPPDSITGKGNLITSDGSVQQQFAACTDDQIIVWDSTQLLGIRCEDKPLGGGSAGINFIPDASFEKGELNPDATALGLLDYPLHTVDDELYSEANLQHYQASWAALSAQDAHVRDTFARTNLSGTQGLFSIWIKVTTVSNQDLQLCLRTDDSDWSEPCESAYLLTVKRDGSWYKYEIPFVYGTASVEYEIFNESYTGALEINIDKIYIGTIPDGYIQQVGQAQFVGELTVQGDINCRFENSAASYSEFPDDTGCDGSYSVIGNVSAPPTSKPNIIINNARTDGYYHVEAKALFANVNTSNSCYFTLSDTTSFNNQPVMGLVTTGNQYGYEVDGDFKFNTGGDKTIRILSESSDGTSACRIFADGSTTANLRDRSLKITVHFYPDSNSTIVSQDTELNHIIYSQQSAQSVPDGIQVVNFFNSDIIKNSQFTIDEANDRIYPNKKGYYLVNVLGSWASNTAIKGLTVLVNDTNPTNGQCREQRDGTTSSGTYHGFVCNLLELNKSDYITILARQESGGNLNLNDLNIQIIEQSIDAKVIGKFEQIEEVTADLTFETVNELSAQVLSGGNTFTQNYSWIDSCSRTSTGIYVCNLVSNFPATQEMACVATTTPNVRITKAEHRQTDTPQTLRVTITDEAGNLSNQAFNVICSKQGTDVNKSFTGAVINASQSAQAIADIVREDIISTDLCQVEAYNTSSDSITANTEDIPFDDETTDNCNAWSNGGNTGSNNKDQFTAQKDGLLLINVGVRSNATVSSWSIQTYKNGVQYEYCTRVQSDSIITGSCVISVSEGDLITFRTSDGFTYQPNAGTTVISQLKITELPDTASIVENLNQNPRVSLQDQYSESEIEWGTWNGQQLYRRCFTTSSTITTNQTLVNWGASLKPVNKIEYTSDFYNLIDVEFSGNYVQVAYRPSTGNVEVAFVGSYQLQSGFTFCMDYTK